MGFELDGEDLLVEFTLCLESTVDEIEKEIMGQKYGRATELQEQKVNQMEGETSVVGES